MKRFFYIVTFIILTGFASCDDIINPKTELEKLPPATQTGKSTFGCLVNGKAWVTRSSTDALADYQSGVLQISAGINETNRKQGITLAVLGGITQSLSYDLFNNTKSEALFGGQLPIELCSYEGGNIEWSTYNYQIRSNKFNYLRPIRIYNFCFWM